MKTSLISFLSLSLAYFLATEKKRFFFSPKDIYFPIDILVFCTGIFVWLPIFDNQLHLLLNFVIIFIYFLKENIECHFISRAHPYYVLVNYGKLVLSGYKI